MDIPASKSHSHATPVDECSVFPGDGLQPSPALIREVVDALDGIADKIMKQDFMQPFTLDRIAFTSASTRNGKCHYANNLITAHLFQ